MEELTPAPISEPATSEPSAPEPQTPATQPPAQRSVKMLLLGLLAGFAPVLLAPLFYLISAFEEAFSSYFLDFGGWIDVLLVLYGVSWLGAIILRVRAKQPRQRSFANGMLIALGLTVALAICGVALLILSLEQGCQQGC